MVCSLNELNEERHVFFDNILSKKKKNPIDPYP
jgi:hypothetical protein